MWYPYTIFYPSALPGYVVVAPDYVGLAVDKNANGNPISHLYLAFPAHANDVFYAVQVAQSALEVFIQAVRRCGAMLWRRRCVECCAKASYVASGRLCGIDRGFSWHQYPRFRIRRSHRLYQWFRSADRHRTTSIFPGFDLNIFLKPALRV